MPTYQYLSNGNPDGTILGDGTSTTPLGFYDNAPVAQPTAITSVTTDAATSTTNAWGYSTSTQADAIVTGLNAVIAALASLGLTA